MNTGSSFLPVVEIFRSIQGEGFWTGTDALFIRLAGCDVGCKWCDQKESWSSKYPLYSVSALVQEIRSQSPRIVVVTGGEPLMHNLGEFAEAIESLDEVVNLHLETSGVHPFSGKWTWVTLSPKRHKPAQDAAYRLANELKIVISNPSDLKWAEEERSKVSDECHLFLQPEWSVFNQAKQWILEHISAHPEWRLSLQTHKFLEVR